MVISNIGVAFRAAFLPLVLMLSLLVGAAAVAADVSVFAVYKRQVYIQSSEAPPVLRCCCPHMFGAVVQLTESNSVPAATLGFADQRTIDLTPGYLDEFLPGRSMLWISEGFSSQKALDAKWPEGNFVFSMFAAKDGAKTSTLDLSGDLYPTHPPHLLNFAEAQAVDAGKDFTLRWTPWEGGTTNDFAFVLIRKAGEGPAVVNTPFLAEPSALDGTASSIIIPAGTLKPGEEYEGYVRIDRVVGRDPSGYAGAVGQASFGSGTHFSIKTVADPR